MFNRSHTHWIFHAGRTIKRIKASSKTTAAPFLRAESWSRLVTHFKSESRGAFTHKDEGEPEIDRQSCGNSL